MIKEELKKLSEEIFYDNQEGGITPQQQRRFYSELIDKVVTQDEVMDVDLSGVQSDILPSGHLTHNLGSEAKAWNNLYVGDVHTNQVRANEINTGQVNGVKLTTGGDPSDFLAGDGSYREISSGWQVSEGVRWCILGDSLLITGCFDSGTSIVSSFTLTIDKKYQERLNRLPFSTWANVGRNGSAMVCEEIAIEVAGNTLRLKPSGGSGRLKIYPAPLLIPLKKENELSLSVLETGTTGLTTITDIAYGNDSFFAVSTSGNYAILSNDSVWRKGEIIDNSMITKAVCGNGLFIAGGFRSFYSLSGDGINWDSIRYMGLDSDLVAITYGNGLFVGVGENSRCVATADPYEQFWKWSEMEMEVIDLTYGDGYFVAVGKNQQAAISTDGLNWTVGHMGTSVHMTSIAYGDGRFVAVGDKECAITMDGLNWTKVETGIGNMCSIAYGDGVFVAITTDAKYAWSPDGINWVVDEIRLNGVLHKITYGDNRFVIVSSGGDYLILGMA